MKKVIYSKYSNERNHCLAIRTDILQDEDGVRYVQKLPEFPEGKLHVEAIYHWYQTFSRELEANADLHQEVKHYQLHSQSKLANKWSKQPEQLFQL